MKTNTLKYTVVKSFREKGITYKVITTIMRLAWYAIISS